MCCCCFACCFACWWFKDDIAKSYSEAEGSMKDGMKDANKEMNNIDLETGEAKKGGKPKNKPNAKKVEPKKAVKK